MSNNQKERGEVKIPAKEFSVLAKSLVERMKTRQEQLFDKAVSIYNQIKTEKKGKRNFPISQRINEILTPERSRYSFSEPKYEFDYTERWQISEALVKENKLVKPKKKDFALESKEHFSSGELSVRLDKKTKTLHWHVSDNNHSVDEAHESYLGKETMRLLNRVKYTNRTGGYFEGTDEYQAEDGRGYSISHRFGKYADPKFIKKEYLAQARTARMMAKFVGNRARAY